MITRILLILWMAATVHARQPNIVLIVTDDMGYSDTGAHGCKDIPTPHMDSIAAKGVRCTSAYVSGMQCSPSRAGFLTGRYQQRFGHEFNPSSEPGSGDLHADEKTIADHFKAAGYATALIGKWHLGKAPEYLPTARGFDEFYGMPSNTQTYMRPMVRDSLREESARKPLPRDYYLTTACGQRAEDFVHRHADQPFFLYLAFNAVHTPLEAPEEYLQRMKHIADPERRKNAAMAVAMDDAIGRVLAAVHQHALEPDTLIFFTNDNGCPNNNAGINLPLRGFKGQTWEGGIRVPFFVQWTGHLPAGSVYGQPVIALDILPTALAAAGVAPSGGKALDGVNLLPFLRGEYAGLPHDALFWRAGDQMAIRMGRWKLTRAIGITGVQKFALTGCDDLNAAQLFDLNADPGEQTDLSAQHPEQKQQLIKAWQAWNATLQAPAWPPHQSK